MHRQAEVQKRKLPARQEIPLDVLYTYHKPKVVRTNGAKRFVYVVPKFVLGHNEKLRILLQEKHGNRSIVLHTKGKGSH